LRVKLHSRIEHVKPVNSLIVCQVVQYGYYPLLQLVRKEYVEQFDGIRDAFARAAVDVFLDELDGPRIVQHREQHVDVFDIALYLPTQRFLDLVGKAFVANLLDGAEVPANVRDISLDGVFDAGDLRNTRFESGFAQ